MAFGRLSQKRSILQQKLKHKLDICILQVCALLHTYVVDKDFVDVDINSCSAEEHCITPIIDAPFGMLYLPNVPDAFTLDGFSTVNKEKDQDLDREYVTLYFRFMLNVKWLLGR